MKNAFKQKKYKIIKDLIDPKEFYNYLVDLKKDGKLSSDDSKAALSASLGIYKDPIFEKLLVDLKPLIEEHAGCPLYKTYSFGRYYEKDIIVRARKSQNACEICVTICLGYERSSWPIGFMDEDQRPQSIMLEPGDALIYKAIEVMYWRPRNIYGKYGQLFLNYVDQNGPFATYKDDHNPKAKPNGTIRNYLRNFKLFK